MNAETRMVSFKLNEHDALLLLKLVRKQLEQDEKIWCTYWRSLVQNLENAIEVSSSRHPGGFEYNNVPTNKPESKK